MASGLTDEQVTNAHLIYTKAVSAGLSDTRAWELVGAAYRESGLSENSVNASSGAFGLFQLLSPGYTRSYQSLVQHGEDPASANIDAILPNYLSWWASHPTAQPGQGAAAVEASGEPPSWYAAGINDVLRGVGPGQLKQISTTGKAPSITDVGANLGAGYGVVGSEAGKAVGAIEKPLTTWFDFVTSWRFAEVVGGFLLLIVGLILVGRSFGLSTPRTPFDRYADRMPTSREGTPRRTMSYVPEDLRPAPKPQRSYDYGEVPF